jgi:hypothetical protein
MVLPAFHHALNESEVVDENNVFRVAALLLPSTTAEVHRGLTTGVLRPYEKRSQFSKTQANRMLLSNIKSALPLLCLATRKVLTCLNIGMLFEGKDLDKTVGSWKPTGKGLPSEC